MNNRKKPKKPFRNPAHIVFPKKGPIRHVVEELPREQEDLELTVGKKFLGALQHFIGIELRDLRRGSEPADLMARSLEGEDVGIQIVEVIDQQLRQLRHQRSSYRDALRQVLGKEMLLFNGCRVSLVDLGDPPFLPPINIKDGQACLGLLAEHLRRAAKDIHTLEVGKIRSRRTKTVSPEREVSVLIERILPAGEPVRYEFNWTGGGPSYQIDISRGILTRAVQSKLSKRYAKPRFGKFILLAYTVDTLLNEDDPDVKASRHLLETSVHPFDDAWFIYLYADIDLGSLVHVWPVDS